MAGPAFCVLCDYVLERCSSSSSSMLCFQPAPGALLGMPCCAVSWSNSRISDSISATQFSLVVMTGVTTDGVGGSVKSSRSGCHRRGHRRVGRPMP